MVVVVVVVVVVVEVVDVVEVVELVKGVSGSNRLIGVTIPTTPELTLEFLVVVSPPNCLPDPSSCSGSGFFSPGLFFRMFPFPSMMAFGGIVDVGRPWAVKFADPSTNIPSTMRVGGGVVDLPFGLGVWMLTLLYGAGVSFSPEVSSTLVFDFVDFSGRSVVKKLKGTLLLLSTLGTMVKLVSKLLGFSLSGPLPLPLPPVEAPFSWLPS